MLNPIPLLISLPQVYRLSEHQHDDWLGSEGASGRESIGLLETLKRLMAEQRARMGGGGGGGEADGEEEEEEDDLLVRGKQTLSLNSMRRNKLLLFELHVPPNLRWQCCSLSGWSHGIPCAALAQDHTVH